MIAFRTADEKGSCDNIDDFSIVVPDSAVQRQAGNLAFLIADQRDRVAEEGAS